MPIAHFPMLSVGMNCALGPSPMRPHLERLQQVSPRWISCHPNAGLAERDGAVRPGPGRHGRDGGRVRRARLGEHHRRLLRHDAGPHRRDRRQRCAASSRTSGRQLRRTCG